MLLHVNSWNFKCWLYQQNHLYHQRQCFKVWGRKYLVPIAQKVKSIRHESEDYWFESPSGWDIFCLKNFDTFARTSVCKLKKMNDIACAQLAFQMLTLQTNIIKYMLNTWCDVITHPFTKSKLNWHGWYLHYTQSNGCNYLFKP